MPNDGLEVPIGVTIGRLQRQLAQAEARMVRTATKMEKRFGQANRRVTQGFNRTGAAANSFASGGLRNASLQLSQVAQQAQAGGGVLRALAIQLPDLTIGFGTLGIAAGVAGGVLLSVLSNMMGAGEDAKSLAEGLQEAASKMDDLKGAADELVEMERQLAQATALRGQAQVNVSTDVIEALRTEIELRRRILEAERAQVEAGLGRLRQQVAEARAEFEELVRPERAITADDARLSEQERAQIQRALTEQTLEAVENNRQLALELAAQNAELQLQEAALASINAALDGTKDSVITAEDAASSLTSTLEGAGMDGLIADAQALADSLGVSLGYALQIAALGDGARAGDPTVAGFEANDPRSAGFNDPSRPGYLTDGIPSRTVSRFRPPVVSAASGRSGGGGGGGTSGQSRMNELMREGASLTERLRTAQERYNDEVARLGELLDAGAISQETYDRALRDIEDRLTGLSPAANAVGQAFDRLFRGLFDGSADASDALRALGAELARLATYDILRSLLPGVFGGGGLIPLPNARGNVFSGGRVVPFARGGIVTRPTLFPMANGAGLMGEAGPEGILPLKRINGRLGVEASGLGGGGEVVVRLDVPEGVTVQETQQIAGEIAVRVVADNTRRQAQAQRRRNGG